MVEVATSVFHVQVDRTTHPKAIPEVDDVRFIDFMCLGQTGYAVGRIDLVYYRQPLRYIYIFECQDIVHETPNALAMSMDIRSAADCTGLLARCA
jgi:hypothetical protein